VFPLAIPMMAGPGAIATTLLLTGNAAYGARLAVIIVVVLAVCLLCMLCFVSASLIARTLGRTGNAVLSRVLGMLLAAYSVQFVINGIAAVRVSLS
jgi:multiple antibiotic resistance protein